MQNLFFTQLSAVEIQELFREEVEKCFKKFFENNPTILTKTNSPETDDIGKGAEFASKIIGKAVPTIYDLCHKRKLPHSKRGGDLYFSRAELLAWIKDGKRKTSDEIKADASAW